MCVIRDIDLGYVLPWIIYNYMIFIDCLSFAPRSKGGEEGCGLLHRPTSMVSYANIGAAGVRESIGYLYQVGIGERFDDQYQYSSNFVLIIPF